MKRTPIAIVAVGLALAVVPRLGLPAFYDSLLYLMLSWIVLATSWNILSGYSGYFSFGHGAFFGAGIYTTSTLLARYEWPFLWTLPMAALVAATLGVALGAQASATALETADVVIMAANLERVPELVALGRQVRRILAQNIALSLGLKLIVLLLATAGMASMWLAVLADVGTSLVVIGNGMRLVRAKK